MTEKVKYKICARKNTIADRQSLTVPAAR